VRGQFLTEAAWRGYRRDAFPRGSWEVEGDVFHALPGAEAVSLVSRQVFGDFDLTLDWRLPVGGNSGILYRVTEELKEPWQSGLEMQLLDNANHLDGRVPETSCGALYGLQAPEDSSLCPVGLYNIARVSVCGSRIEHWLNGVRVIACDMAGADFRTRVERSKFRDFPSFARASNGQIVLQHHSTEVWFCNIRIEVPGE